MKLVEDLNNVDEEALSSEQLERVMHERGLPMRHLGKLCTSVSAKFLSVMTL